MAQIDDESKYENEILDDEVRDDKLGITINCINEFRILADKLRWKWDCLRRREEDLGGRETELVRLSEAIEGYVEARVARERRETDERYEAVKQRYKLTRVDLERLKRSFDTIRSDNQRLRGTIIDLESRQDTINKEARRGRGFKDRGQLAAANTAAVDGLSEARRKDVIRCDVSIQTRLTIGGMSPSQHQWGHTGVMYEMWLRLFQPGLSVALINGSSAIDRDESLRDLCLLVIPQAIDCLKQCLRVTSSSGDSNSFNGVNASADIITKYIEMLHWTTLYLDLYRFSPSRAIMNSLNRLSEEIIKILRSLSDSSDGDKREISVINQPNIHATILLVCLRSVTHVNDFSFVISRIIGLITKHKEVLTVFLSKLLFVPLLCRWSAVFNWNGTISSKIIHLLHQSLNETANISLYKGSIILEITGFDQLVLLGSKIPLAPTDADASPNYHPLVVLLDLLYMSNPSDKEIMIDIMGKIISDKCIRRTVVELGLVGTITSLISKYNDCSESAIDIHCVNKLKTILNRLNKITKDP